MKRRLLLTTEDKYRQNTKTFSLSAKMICLFHLANISLQFTISSNFGKGKATQG